MHTSRVYLPTWLTVSQAKVAIAKVVCNEGEETGDTKWISSVQYAKLAETGFTASYHLIEEDLWGESKNLLVALFCCSDWVARLEEVYLENEKVHIQFKCLLGKN